MATVYDVIVVGAGIEGSATAYNAAKKGMKTLLLEQFSLPHSRGSSHGHSRITRKAYAELHFAEMMSEAFSMWDTLEKESDSTFYKQSGILVVSRKTDTEVNNVVNSLKAMKFEHEQLTNDDMNKKFPMLTFDSTFHGVYENEGGILLADRALAGFQKVFKQRGGVIRDAEPLVKLLPGQPVTVVTTKSQYQARSVVLTVGPWANKVLGPLNLQLPLKPVRIKVFYWRQKQPNYTIEQGYPCVIFVDGQNHFYSLPAHEYPDLVKLCWHDGQAIDPDKRDIDVDSYTKDFRSCQDLVKAHLPGVETEPSITEVCMYTWTPDESFILDTHPQHKNIIIGAGFSGHGFKLAPVVGSILADLALGKMPKYNMDPFKLNRFSRINTAKL